MLNAAVVTNFIAPDTLIEGDSAEVIADVAGGVGQLRFDWTVVVDGEVVQRSTSRELPLETRDNGDHEITVRITDDSGDPPTVASTSITVLNAPPQIVGLTATPTSEGAPTTLTGTIEDPGLDDTFTLIVSWGDGTQETFSLAADERDFSVQHTYVDDPPGDEARIVVGVVDDDGSGRSDLTTIAVTNVAPSIVDLSATPVDEGGETTLTGSVEDPGSVDSFTLTIDWGDGVIETISLGADEREFSLNHRYADDNPTATVADLVTIRVSAEDKDGGVSDTVETTTIVSNVAPSIIDLAATDTDEGGETLLTGRIEDPGLEDTFTLSIDWGDGQSDTLSLAADERDFSLRHTYADDDPTGTPADRPTIRVTVVDDDSLGRTATISPLVSNVAPEIVDLTATDLTEGGLTTLTGRIVDPGVNDTFTVAIDWGDGATDSFAVGPDQRSFSLTHRFIDDDPTGTPADRPTIRVTVVDDDTGTGTAVVTPLVSNAPPVIDAVADRTLNEGQLLRLSDNGGATFSDAGVIDTHTAIVDWGDGSAAEPLAVSFSGGTGRLEGEHTYADDGRYTVTITLTDDDTGATQQSFVVTVGNIDPVLTGTSGLVVDEGTAVDLATLGVGVTDPGFDNPLNTNDPSNGGETEEFFLDGVIDWGDGSPATAVRFMVTMPGQPGEPTIATPIHAPHHYADNGVYTVTVSFSDDDGPIVDRQLTITVNNVAPTLTLNDPGAVINEGTLLQLPSLGSFSDPGFDNPSRPGGPSEESFSYTIDWGDGTIETLRLPSAVFQGSPTVDTTGLLAAEHFYADNDSDGTRDNRYTITVTLSDDDGGSDTRTFDVTVLNVAPTLQPIAATDLEGDGITTLDLSFSDPGADVFEVLVDWGDKFGLPPEERFVVERVHAGPTPESFTIQHRYFGPPDPANPSADIVISVLVRDDDFGSAALVVGQSNLETIAISNSGVEDNQVAIDTTPQAPEISFPERVEPIALVERVVEPPVDRSTATEGASSADAGVGAERYLELRIVRPDGIEASGYRLPDDALVDLPELFARLPDNRYRIYVVEAQTETRRLVLDVNVRGGRVIDPSDDSDGGRDRPPELSAPQVEAPNQPPVAEPTASNWVEPPADLEAGPGESTAGVTAVSLAAARLAKAERIERAVRTADEVRWRRLFRRKPR